MEMKKVAIPIIILLLIIVGVVFFLNYNNGINVGDSKVSLPDGFNVTNETNHKSTVSNGEFSIDLNSYGKININDKINEYVESKDKLNQTVNFTEITLADTKVNKSVVLDEKDNRSYVIYWFTKDDCAYAFNTNIQNLQENQDKNLDSAVETLINGTRSNMFSF